MSVYEDASLILPIAPYRKAGEIYSLKPTDGTGDFTVARNTVCDEIDSTGASVSVGVNVPRFDYREDYVAPTDGSYYSFDGVDDKVDLANLLVNPVTNPFSLIVKLKTGSDVTTLQVIYSASDGTNRYVLGIESGELCIFTFDGAIINKAGYAININTEYHIAITKDNTNTTKNIYINGSLVVNTAGVTLTSSSVVGQKIGQLTNGTTFLLGDIYTCQTENYEMSASEVLDRYNGVAIPSKYVGATNEERIANGGMETGGTVDVTLPTNWSTEGAPTVALKSNVASNGATGKVYSGSYSVYVENVASQGIKSDAITFIEGKNYQISAWIYIVSGSSVINMTRTAPSVIDFVKSTVATIGAWQHVTVEAVALTTGSCGVKFLQSGVGSTIFYADDVSIKEAGNTLNLSTGKIGEYGEDVVVNGDFATDSDWTKGTNWSISGGKAISAGATANLYQNNVTTLEKYYRITFTIVDYISGDVRFEAGNSYSSNYSANGTYTIYLESTVSTTIRFNPQGVFFGSVDNVVVEEVPQWYDLEHDIQGQVLGAVLTDSTDFGSNYHGVATCPVLLTEPAFNTLFDNSATPVTQTITTVVGTTYTVNCKNEGIISISEASGTGQGGTATEVYPFTYTATETSVDVTLVAGHSFDFVQMTDTDVERNHVPTLGSGIAKALDDISVTTPIGVTEIIETIDGVEQAPITTIPVTYDIPVSRMNSVIMNS